MVYALMLTYSERTLEGNLVLLDVLDGSIGDSGLAVLDDRSDIDRLPSNGGLENVVLAQVLYLVTYTSRVVMTNLGGGEDFLDGLGNLGADTVTLNQADQVVALRIMLVQCQLQLRP
jgi:hypothetical protein